MPEVPETEEERQSLLQTLKDELQLQAWLMEAEMCEALAESESGFAARSCYFSAGRTAREAADTLGEGEGG